MKNLNSITLFFMGMGFFILGMIFTHTIPKILALLASSILAVVGAIKSFKEKNNR